MKLLSFQFQDHIYFLYKWWQKKSKLLQKQIAHVSQDDADPNLLYLQCGWSAFDIGLIQDIEVEWALKYLNWEKKGGTMTNKFNVGGGGIDF